MSIKGRDHNYEELTHRFVVISACLVIIENREFYFLILLSEFIIPTTTAITNGNDRGRTQDLRVSRYQYYEEKRGGGERGGDRE